MVVRTTYCLQCGPSAEAPRTQRRLEVTAGGSAPAMAPLLALLTGAEEDEVAPVVALGRFEIDVAGAPRQVEMLQSVLSGAGATAHATETTFGDPPRSLRWDWSSRHVLPKVCVTVALGGGAAVLGIPLVTAAAVVTVGALVVRAARFIPHRLSIPRHVSDTLLEPVDPAILAEARATLGAMSDGEAAARVRACVDAFAEIAWTLRSDGAHLRRRDLLRIDEQLRELLRQTLRLASTAERLGAFAKQKDALSDRVRSTSEEVAHRLDAIQAALATMRGGAIELHASGARATADAPQRMLGELQLSLATAIEVAQLPGDVHGV